jgi:hypothetical protein
MRCRDHNLAKPRQECLKRIAESRTLCVLARHEKMQWTKPCERAFEHCLEIKLENSHVHSFFHPPLHHKTVYKHEHCLTSWRSHNRRDCPLCPFRSHTEHPLQLSGCARFQQQQQLNMYHSIAHVMSSAR